MNFPKLYLRSNNGDFIFLAPNKDILDDSFVVRYDHYFENEFIAAGTKIVGFWHTKMMGDNIQAQYFVSGYECINKKSNDDQNVYIRFIPMNASSLIYSGAGIKVNDPMLMRSPYFYKIGSNVASLALYGKSLLDQQAHSRFLVVSIKELPIHHE